MAGGSVQNGRLPQVGLHPAEGAGLCVFEKK